MLRLIWRSQDVPTWNAVHSKFITLDKLEVCTDCVYLSVEIVESRLLCSCLKTKDRQLLPLCASEFKVSPVIQFPLNSKSSCFKIKLIPFRIESISSWKAGTWHQYVSKPVFKMRAVYEIIWVLTVYLSTVNYLWKSLRILRFSLCYRWNTQSKAKFKVSNGLWKSLNLNLFANCLQSSTWKQLMNNLIVESDFNCHYKAFILLHYWTEWMSLFYQ